jgi:hypothetical protein
MVEYGGLIADEGFEQTAALVEDHMGERSTAIAMFARSRTRWHARRAVGAELGAAPDAPRPA